MNSLSKKLVQSAGALAVAALLAACGGGEATPPVETVPPTVTITDNEAAENATGPVTFTFKFSEDVGSTFVAEDVTVTGGTAGALAKVDAMTYTLVVTPAAASTGRINVSLGAAKFKDIALNDNAAMATASQAFDTTTAPPVGAGTVVADFDAVVPVVRGPDSGGTGFITKELPAGGGTGSALGVLRSGGEPWALNVLQATVPFTADRKTLSAKVYSPTAGIRMAMKVEGSGGAVEVDANEVVNVGWQTLTWTFSAAKSDVGAYNLLVILPNFMTVDAAPGKTYYFDDIKLLPAAVAPPAGTDTVVADFDAVVPVVRGPDSGGTGFITKELPAGGGTGSALGVLRSGGEPWALNVLQATVPFTADRKTLSAQVYSPTAGIRMSMKVEGSGGAVEIDANEVVKVGWQTLTWTFSAAKSDVGAYNLLVILPNFMTVDPAPGKTYYFDDIKLLPAAVAPPAGTDTVVADFDAVVPVVRGPDSGGTGFITKELPAGGGTGSVLGVLRSGGEPWALNVLQATVPFTADRKTLSAQVYSPTAGIRMTMKVEGSGGAVEIDANEVVKGGWQTLTWTFSAAKSDVGAYNLLVILPNFMTVDPAPGKTYYFDDIKLLAAAGGGGGGTTPPGAGMGSGGPQTLTVATGDVKTGDGGNTMFVAGEALFAVNYVGSAEAAPPNNLAAWPNARTASFSGITGISGGDIGYFQDDVNLSNSSQKVDEGGWVAGTALAPLGVPNFFRFFVLKGPVSNDAYMGLYMNAPNNGTVNVSSFSKIKIKVWGPGPMFERTNFNPVLEITLTGPKVAGCTTGSGGSEIKQNLTANQKNGAGGFYTLPLSGFTVKGLCGTDSGAANVLANLARVVVTVPGTSFNYTNAVDGTYSTGVNLGPVGFTNK